MIRQKPREGLTIDVVPAPLGLEGRNRLRCFGEQPRRVDSGCVNRTKPVPRDDAEVAAAAAGVSPPELTIGIRAFARSDHGARATVHADGDDFHAIEVVGGKAELPAEKAERTAADMPAHANLRILA